MPKLCLSSTFSHSPMLIINVCERGKEIGRISNSEIPAKLMISTPDPNLLHLYERIGWDMLWDANRNDDCIWLHTTPSRYLISASSRVNIVLLTGTLNQSLFLKTNCGLDTYYKSQVKMKLLKNQEF